MKKLFEQLDRIENGIRDLQGLTTSPIEPLLNPASKHSPMCHCPPNTCQAPIIMGKQMPCRDPKRPMWDKFKI